MPPAVQEERAVSSSDVERDVANAGIGSEADAASSFRRLLADNLAKTKQVAQLRTQNKALQEQLDLLWGRNDGVAGGAVRSTAANGLGQDKSITCMGGHARVELTLDEDYSTVMQSELQANTWRESLAAQVCAALSMRDEDRGRLRVVELHPGSIVATLEISPGAPGTASAEELAQELAAQAAEMHSPLRQRLPSAVSARVLPSPKDYSATGNAPSGGVFETESSELVRFCQTEPSTASLAFFGHDAATDKPKPRHVVRVYEAVHQLKLELDKTSRELQRQRGVNKALEHTQPQSVDTAGAEKQDRDRRLTVSQPTNEQPTVPLAPADTVLAIELDQVREQLIKEKETSERRAASISALTADMQGLVKERENIRRQLTKSDEAYRRLQAAHAELQRTAATARDEATDNAVPAPDLHMRKSQSFPVPAQAPAGREREAALLTHARSMMPSTSSNLDATQIPGQAPTTSESRLLTSSQDMASVRRSYVPGRDDVGKENTHAKKVDDMKGRMHEPEEEDAGLPPGWKIEFFQGSKLYVNHEAKAFSWEHPLKIDAKAPEEGPTAGATATGQASLGFDHSGLAERAEGNRHEDRGGSSFASANSQGEMSRPAEASADYGFHQEAEVGIGTGSDHVASEDQRWPDADMPRMNELDNRASHAQAPRLMFASPHARLEIQNSRPGGGTVSVPASSLQR